MVVYKVYRAKFKTRLGTRRVYVGHTKCICIRKSWAEKEPPAAMRCRDPRELSYTIIEDGIETKAQALALEALYAARHIMAEPDICRGGPWSNESLSDNQKDELQAASRCNSLYKLYELAESDKRGSLYRHLKDLEFIKPDDAPSSTTVVRGAVIRVRKSSGESGPCGSKYRRAAVEAGVLTRPSAHFTRLKRGCNYDERRAAEQQNRPSRPGGDKARKKQAAKNRVQNALRG